MTAQTGTAPDTNADFAALVQQGSEALSRGDLQAALTAYESVVQAFPDQAEGFNNLGSLYSALGELEKAEACFGRVIDLVPGNPHVLYNRGVVRSRREDYAGAREDFADALKLAPRDPDVLNNMGVTEYLMGRIDPARRHFKRALKIRPDYEQALLNLCDLMHDDEPAGAIDLCREFLALQGSTAVRRMVIALQETLAERLLGQAAADCESLLAGGDNAAEAAEQLDRLRTARRMLAGPAQKASATG